MSRQIGPWSHEPLAVMLEWRLRELDARLRALESRLASLTAEEAREMAAGLLAQADAADEQTADAGVAD